MREDLPAGFGTYHHSVSIRVSGRPDERHDPAEAVAVAMFRNLFPHLVFFQLNAIAGVVHCMFEEYQLSECRGSE